MHALADRSITSPDITRQAQRLRVLRRAILGRVARTETDLAALGASVAAPPEDEAQEATTAALLLRLDDLARRELAEIDAALARIVRGTYGRCVRCGDVISAARLEILPDARECVSCARGTTTGAPLFD